MNIDESIIKAKHEAIKSHYSVWVAASAGSGKTTVLTHRVLNLLLSKTQPSKILCLTFTKAAAAEMSNRITNELKIWTAASTEELRKRIQALRGFMPDEATLLKARQLFTNVLEAPSGMKIMTIHAFCQSVLKRFPIEAGISPQFEIIDDTAAGMLIKKAFDSIVSNESFASSLSYMSDYFQTTRSNNVFSLIRENMAALRAFLKKYPDISKVEEALRKKFNLSEYLDENAVVSEFFKNDFVPAANPFPQNFLDIVDSYKKLRSTKKSDPLKLEEKAICLKAYQNYTTIRLIRLTICFLNIVRQFLETYQNFKKKENILDYDDLIDITIQLLSEHAQRQWVMYKLDGGIDHILVDEAQDTNAEQWEIIKLISEEFFSGYGQQTGIEHTLFVVGDKKQSIFSFQGADPLKFDEMKTYFQDKIINSRHEFKVIPLNASFRSTEAVLNLVNNLLKHPVAKSGVTEEDATHNLTRVGEPGLIEIHQPVTPHSDSSSIIWPIAQKNQTISSITKVSEEVADKIKSFFDNHEILESTNLPIEPKDITILVRKRSSIVSELVRVLKSRGIPVAGIDRLTLSDHIAVKDLMALAKFALLPEDDLNLAVLLKSPVIGLSEEEMSGLCMNRENQTLWEKIIQQNNALTDRLMNILDLADKMPVYEFFSSVLNVYGARRKFWARLGFEAMEAIDEFLNLTLEFEQTNFSSLQNFVFWFDSRESVIKRDMEQSEQNTVKIMTVHASKGLQNNIIFIVDNQNTRAPTLRLLWDDELPLWVPLKGLLEKSETAAIYDKALKKQEEEEHRLLYVALTRAKDRIYIYGWGKKPSKAAPDKEKKPEKTWYQLVCATLEDNIPDKNGTIQIYCPPAYRPRFSMDNASPGKAQNSLPDWVSNKAPEETPLSKPLMPSRLIENEPLNESIVAAGQEKALKRGTFLHRLLQYLPMVPYEKREEIALKLKPEDIELPERFFDIFNNEFRSLFDSNSMAEVPIAGIVGDKVFSGQIDRLVIWDHEVWIVDYKTNRHVPSDPKNVHRIYKMQLAAYKSLIKKIFADKIIKTFLLWTENMSLMEMTSETESFDDLFKKENI